MKARFLFACFVLMVMSSCMTPSKMNTIMDSWTNSHESDLIAAWGPPQQVMSDGRDGKVFIYTQQVNYTTPGTATTTTNVNGYGYGNTANVYGTSYTTYNPSQTYGYQRQRIFFINSDGQIYRWSWRGL